MSTGTFKDTLMSALHTAVQHFNQSQDPNDAVVKAAGAFDFNPEQTTRLVETFNTARTLYHYKNASDRSANFRLADSAAVLLAMFKTEPKAASAPSGQLVDYSSYGIPEAQYQDGMVVKAAGVQDVEVPEPRQHQNVDADLGHECWKAERAIHVMRDLSKLASDEARMAQTRIHGIMQKLASALSLGYEEECRDKWSRLIAGFGEDPNYAPVMLKLSDYVPKWLNTGLTKHADVVDDRDLGEYEKLMDEAREWMEVEAEFLATSDTWNKEANDFEAEFTGMVAPALPKPPESVVSLFNPRLVKAAQQGPGSQGGQGSKQQGGGKDDKKPSSGGKKPSGGGGDTNSLFGGLLKGVSEGVKGQVSKTVESGMERAMNAPVERSNAAMSDRLKNVQRQLMLEDLLTNDEVLSEEDPQRVAEAYAAVLKMSPEVAGHKEVVRAILRQVVHSVAVSPYDAQNWATLEQSLRNISGKNLPAGGPK